MNDLTNVLWSNWIKENTDVILEDVGRMDGQACILWTLLSNPYLNLSDPVHLNALGQATINYMACKAVKS